MIPDDTDLLTYSFPCQDLSIGSVWYNKDNDGIRKGAKTRSGLLWEIERILRERIMINVPLPKFLLMENVNAITSPNTIQILFNGKRNSNRWVIPIKFIRV